MAEIRRGTRADGKGLDRLPWLEPVEDEDEGIETGGTGRLLVWGMVALATIGLLIGAVVMARRWSASRTDIGGIIRAPAGPYKTKPADPGGLAVDTSAAVAEQTGTGSDIDAPLALVTPEQPMTLSRGRPPAGAPATAPASARPSIPAPAPNPVPQAPTSAAPQAGMADGGTIQLGAFSSEAKARAAWKSLSRRFAFLAPMTPAISPVESGEATLYRLRANGGGPAARLCAQLQVAGESCGVVG